MGQITVGPVSVSVYGSTTYQQASFTVSLSAAGTTATVTLNPPSAFGISGDNIVTLTSNQTTGAFSCQTMLSIAPIANWSGSLQISFTNQIITANTLNVSLPNGAADSFSGQLIGW